MWPLFLLVWWGNFWDVCRCVDFFAHFKTRKYESWCWDGIQSCFFPLQERAISRETKRSFIIIRGYKKTALCRLVSNRNQWNQTFRDWPCVWGYIFSTSATRISLLEHSSLFFIKSSSQFTSTTLRRKVGDKMTRIDLMKMKVAGYFCTTNDKYRSFKFAFYLTLVWPLFLLVWWGNFWDGSSNWLRVSGRRSALLWSWRPKLSCGMS